MKRPVAAAIVVLAACSGTSEQDRRAARRDRWYEVDSRAARELPRPVQDADAPEACPHRPSNNGRSCALTEEQRTDLHLKVARMRGALVRELERACLAIAVSADWTADQLDRLARECRSMAIDFEGRTLLHTLDDRELRAFADHLERSPGTLRQRLDDSMRD